MGKLNQLEAALKSFEIKKLEKQPAEEMVLSVKRLVNE